MFLSNGLIIGKDQWNREGAWSAKIKKDKIQFRLKFVSTNGKWSTSMNIKKNELSKFQTGNSYSFTLEREAGKIAFTGKFENTNGGGNFF
jgi:hypothetical protein